MVDAVVTPPPPTAWHTGIANADPELIGHITNKGWHEKPVAEAAYEAAKAHRDAEKLIGVPANQLVRLPTDAADEAGWSNVWARLGAPKDAKDYDFTPVKNAKGDPIDAKLADVVRAAAAKYHLPKDAAAGLAQEFIKFNDTNSAAATVEEQAKLADEYKALDTNWGANKDANMFVAKKAAQALGVSPETVQALEKQIGYAKVMEMFRAIGSKIGEDKFVTSDRPAGGVMTREQAQAKLSELKHDTAWANRFLAGDVAAKREMEALTILISGDDTEVGRRA